MAPDRHAAAQEPQPLHRTSFTSATFTMLPMRFSSTSSIAPNGQTSTQNPQPRHSLEVTTETWASTLTFPDAISMSALDAAALAWATVSGMSLGPWQQPARNMPSDAVSTGPVSYTHLRAHETRHDLVCRLLLEK